MNERHNGPRLVRWLLNAYASVLLPVALYRMARGFAQAVRNGEARR